MVPINKVVETSGYDKSDIVSIVLVGGGTRIPKIRELLTDFLGKFSILYLCLHSFCK